MKRVASIDIIRALTMLTMLFVNDFAGMSGLPHWLHHAAMKEDMLGFSDLVFPAFLFCVGLSIPFAIGARYRKGDQPLQVIGHILGRTLALLVMGVFAMNLRGVEGGLSHAVFTLLAVAGFFLVWNVYPKRDNGRLPWWATVLRLAGVLLLAWLVLYKDLHGMPFRTGWWGILGLIGWAYLPCALAFVFLKGDFKKMTGFWILTLLLCVLNAVPAIPRDWSIRWMILSFWPGGWTHPAICASGLFTSMLLIHSGDRPRKLAISYGMLALAMFVLGLLSHPVWIISKILATPTWLFFCVAISVACFAVIWWIADVRGLTRWARPISPAGTATLTCYTIPYIWYAVQELLGAHWPPVLTAGIPGLIKAFVFSLIIIGLTWCFTKIHVKLKV
ncbi:MAG: DUF5009 domain-containing protein [Bacteroidales bacterium]|jgi:predicted acyltransferase|nr:DUF5009 domain-containing protein [Bacteroidales bacterium]